jgi:hypothetical protein
VVGRARDLQRWGPHTGFVVANLGFSALFLLLLLSAFHQPTPHDLPVGVVAPAPAVQQIRQALDTHAAGAFSVIAYPDEAAARTGISHRDIDGAYVTSSNEPQLLTADAAGTAPTQAVTGAFQAVAARTGQRLTVIDVVPPSTKDSAALSPFFVILGVQFPSLAAGAGSAIAFRRAHPVWCAGAPVVVAGLVGLAAAGIADGVAGLGSFPAMAGITALFSLAISAPTAFLGRVKAPLAVVAVLVFMVLGLPDSGGPSGLAGFGPGFLRTLDSVLPLGVAATTLRNAVYFHGYDTAGHLWVLAAWAVGGLVALTLLVLRGDRSASLLITAPRRHRGVHAAS